MASNNKQTYDEFCEKCGKETRALDYQNICKATGKKHMHYECESCGYISKTRIVKHKKTA